MSIGHATGETSAVMDCLLAADRRLCSADVVRLTGHGPRSVPATLARLAKSGRVSTFLVNAHRREFWVTAPQREMERLLRQPAPAVPQTATLVMVAAPVSEIGVAILSDPARLAGRLMYLERLATRPVFAGDATLLAIARDYRATLAAIHSLEEAADNEKAVA